jgi:hypothetical protein
LPHEVRATSEMLARTGHTVRRLGHRAALQRSEEVAPRELLRERADSSSFSSHWRGLALLAIPPTYGFDGATFAAMDSGSFVARDARRSWTEVAPPTASSQVETVVG